MTSRSRGVAVSVLAASLIVLAGWLWWDASSRGAVRTAGAEAMQVARESIPAMLSYRPVTVETDLGAARERLTGRFLEDYTQNITTVVIPNAKQRKVTAVVKVPAAAVISAERDRAVVLAYVDQTVTEGAQPPTAIASAARVSMEKIDGRWLIAGFELQ